MESPFRVYIDMERPLSRSMATRPTSPNLYKAEYLWKAASRQGLRSILLYFIGYPPTVEGANHIDWFWRPGKATSRG